MKDRIVKIENGKVVQRIVLPATYRDEVQKAAQDLALSGQWLNGRNAKGREYLIGDTWDVTEQDYIPPCPFLGWIWSDQDQDHVPPVPMPGPAYDWNEETQTWDPIPVLVDINAATEAELEALDGVGPATAAAIVLERNTNGLFTSLLNLSVRVDGVSAAMADGWTNAYVGEAV